MPKIDSLTRQPIPFATTIVLETQKVGIFGKLVTLDNELKEGDRIEIYRPITAVIAEEDDE